MLLKVAISIVCVILGVVVPALEANATHLLNPLWPPHARLHEAWQLLSNASLAAFCLWLAWRRGMARVAALALLAITGSFLAAYLASGFYGGSMGETTSAGLSIGGVNPAVVVMAVAAAVLSVGLLVTRERGAG